jgi:S-DNA-T family DNA segregation ATPase FtsK/SpoIIIE
MKQANKNRTALFCLGIAACVVLFCSCLGFNIGDAPSRHVWPHNNPPENWCGAVGAFCAYYLLYYIGPGVFLALVAVAAVLIVKLAGGCADQPVLRAAGAVLLTVAGSASFYLLWPNRLYGFPAGSGGVLGVAAAVFLKTHLAVLGTAIVLTGAWVVGLLLLADTAVAVVWHGCGLIGVGFLRLTRPAFGRAARRSQALAEIWRRLRARQIQMQLSPRPVCAAGATISGSSSAAALRPQGRSATGLSCADTAIMPVKVPPARQPARQLVPADYAGYVLPPVELLAEPETGPTGVQDRIVKSKAAAMEKLLSEFDLTARVVAAETGPVITMFELELAPGIKVSQISNLANDMARALGAGAVRVVAPLPGKHTIGIEVPNSEKEKVRIKQLVQLAGARPQRMQIPLFLGRDSAGEALVSDLTVMPHLLIAGTTGSGKSVCISSIITSILLTKRPDEVKLILIDPKMVEMTTFNVVPHLMCPIVTEIKRAEQILEWAAEKMDERYALFAEARVKNITAYNELTHQEIIERFQPASADEEAKIPKRLPYIVIVIDELADLMMTAAKEIEGWIVRLAQKSRAIGIHLVLATQRPQATVVTGLIKSNMPTRISFRVAAKMDSRIILDQNGAETLLGEGDMLFLQPGTSELIRAQGTFVDEAEVKRVVKHLKEIAEPQFHPELTQLGRLDPAQMEKDELFDQAARIILETQRGSVSLLQRRLSIGYARASRIIEMMAAAGVLGEYKGSQAREVMMTLEEYERLCERLKAEQAPAAAVGSPADSSLAARDYHNEAEYGYVSVDNQTD